MSITSLQIIDIDDVVTVNVIVQGGIISQTDLTTIDGFVVKKGTGNTAATIEVGDYISGWIGDEYVSGKVTAIPVNDSGDVNTAIYGQVV